MEPSVIAFFALAGLVIFMYVANERKKKQDREEKKK